MTDRDCLLAGVDDLIRGGMTGMGVLIALRDPRWQEYVAVTDPALIDEAIDSVRDFQAEPGGLLELKVLDVVWTLDKGRVVAVTRIT